MMQPGRSFSVTVEIADEDVTGGVPRNVGRLTELAVDGRKRWVPVALPWFGLLVGGFLLPPEDHRDVAFRVEPHDHVRHRRGVLLDGVLAEVHPHGSPCGAPSLLGEEEQDALVGAVPRGSGNIGAKVGVHLAARGLDREPISRLDVALERAFHLDFRFRVE